MRAEITTTAGYDDEYGRVVYDMEATNGNGQTVLVYTGITLVERRRAGD